MVLRVAVAALVSPDAVALVAGARGLKREAALLRQARDIGGKQRVVEVDRRVRPPGLTGHAVSAFVVGWQRRAV